MKKYFSIISLITILLYSCNIDCKKATDVYRNDNIEIILTEKPKIRTELVFVGTELNSNEVSTTKITGRWYRRYKDYMEIGDDGYYSQIVASGVKQFGTNFGKWEEINDTIILIPLYSIGKEYGDDEILKKVEGTFNYYKLHNGKLHFIGIKNKDEGYIDVNRDNREGTFENKYPYFFLKVE